MAFRPIQHECTRLLLIFYFAICCLCTEDLMSTSDGLTEVEVDPKGYILYCPCMGRFGNQADQFLGALAFSKSVDRTLVLAPWVEYQTGVRGSSQVPFDKYFQVSELQKYHRVMTMGRFMQELAPTVWPVGSRTSFCYRSRTNVDDEKRGCDAKNGNPFGPFWDNVKVDFDASEYYGPLSFSSNYAAEWKTRFPADKWPVLAFTGTPGNFPVTLENAKLQKYLKWGEEMLIKAKEVSDRHLPRPYVGIHLRIGSDWEKACSHVPEGQKRHLFASAQCLGQNLQFGVPSKEMCLPSVETVLTQLSQAIEKTSAQSVFIARDDKRYDKEIIKHLAPAKVRVYWLANNDPHLDLVLLAQSDHYIGNCISTFSSFVTRERNVDNLPTTFWAFKTSSNGGKDEL